MWPLPRELALRHRRGRGVVGYGSGMLARFQKKTSLVLGLALSKTDSLVYDGFSGMEKLKAYMLGYFLPFLLFQLISARILSANHILARVVASVVLSLANFVNNVRMARGTRILSWAEFS